VRRREGNHQLHFVFIPSVVEGDVRCLASFNVGADISSREAGWRCKKSTTTPIATMEICRRIIQDSSRAILGPGGDCEEVRGRGPEALGLGE
jgi:hypothetical protein